MSKKDAYYGYTGQIADIDLTKSKVTITPLDKDFARNYLGGTGFAARILWDRVTPNTQPLDPDNPLIFGVGPVTGAFFSPSGRFMVAFKSPLTGILCDSSSGGHWGAALRMAGYDGLIIEGAAASPVYLHIDEKKCEIRDASPHWGKDTFVVQDDIRREIGDPKARLVVIGGDSHRLLS